MILPAVAPLLTPEGRIITLIKPQFEVGKGEVGKGGIVTDPAKHERVVDQVNRVGEDLGLRVCGVIRSPIHGASGNVEFLALYVVSEPGAVATGSQTQRQRIPHTRQSLWRNKG